MITDNDLRKTLEDCNAAGYNVKVRDVAYVLLCRYFLSKETAFKTLYPNSDEEDCKEYAKSKTAKFLKDYLDNNFKEESATKSKAARKEELTFEENKREMIRLIETTQKALDQGEIEAKDGLKIIADLRVKLNDKFSVNDTTKDNLIFVEKKYNTICRHGYECYMPTREDIIEDLKREGYIIRRNDDE